MPKISEPVLKDRQRRAHGKWLLPWQRSWRKLGVTFLVVMDAMRDAIVSGQKEMVQLFLNAGVSPDSTTSDYHPFLHHAAGSGHLEIVHLLVEHGAPIRGHKREDKYNDYGLSNAVKNGHSDIVDYLLERGAVAWGEDLLMKAAADGNVRIIQSLLRHGAQILSLSNNDTDLIKRATSTIENNYSLPQRIDKIENAFDVLRINRSKFQTNYKLTPETKQLFLELNESLLDLDSLQKSDERPGKTY